MKIFTLNKSNLISEISNYIDISDALTLEKFQDGEFLPKFTQSIRGENVFIISQVSTSDQIISTCLTIDAAKRAGANHISLVLPYTPYSRQEKVDHLRSSIGSKMIADIFEKVGISQLLTIDLHSSAITGFYNVPVIHLNGNKIFIKYFQSLELKDICIVSPDQGAIKKNVDFAKAFPGSTFGVINKKRIKPNEIHSMELIGDVKDKNVIIIDDIIDTGGTLKKATDLIMKEGALSVRAVATHGILSGSAIENIESSKLQELVVSDTIEITAKSDKIHVISCATVLSKAINNLSLNKSINEINTIRGGGL